MNKSKKFSILVTLILASTVFLNINALDFSDKMKEIPENYEEDYTNSVCNGNNNIIKAGCSVIAGQAVRGVPAMAFGASFNNIKGCVQELEKKSGTSVTVNTDNTCQQFGLLNPNLDTSKFVYEAKPSETDYSLLGLTNNLYKLNKNIVENTFDNSYYAYKAIENVPVAKEVFAQSQGNLYYLGGFFQAMTYNAWVTVRNISYGLIGLLSIILGLTLMSSNSIFDNNAKWRLSLEQAIPRVVIAIILIQFSYLLGETVLFIANNSNFEPIFRYVFNVPAGSGWWNAVTGFGTLAPTAALGLLFFMAGGIPGVGQVLMIGALVLGLWYLYRLLILWWYNFTVVFEVCIFTLASPLIIAISLLPGEAGALQTRRYFSTLISLLGRTFVLQLVSAGPTIFAYSLLTYFSQGAIVAYGTPIISFIPLIVSIIILGYADNAQNLANQFARNVTGADPIGAQPQGR